jgi:hypothetical protein
MKLVAILLLSVLVFPLIQTINNAQFILAQSGNTNNSVSQNDIQNNPGFSQYIPGTGFLKNTPNNLGNESLSNSINGSGQASIDARMAMSNDADKGGLIQDNPGFSQYIPGTGFLNNTSNNNNTISSNSSTTQ